MPIYSLGGGATGGDSGSWDHRAAFQACVTANNLLGRLDSITNGVDGILDLDSGGDSVTAAKAEIDLWDARNSGMSIALATGITDLIAGFTQTNTDSYVNEWTPAYAALVGDAYDALDADVGGDQVATAIGHIETAKTAIAAFLAL